MVPLVLGAAGFLGLNTVDAFLDAGIQPRCGRRRRTNVLALRRRRCPMVHADLDDPVSLESAMRGVDVVVHSAALYPRVSLEADRILADGLRQTRNVLDAAVAAGVRRLVFASSTATVAPSSGGAPSTEVDIFHQAPGHGVYHDLKWSLERAVMEERRLEVTVACPAGCIGPWDLRVGTSALLVATARGLDPPHPDGLVNLVDARDVGRALVRLAACDDPPRRVLLSAHDLRLHHLLGAASLRYGAPPPRPALSAEESLALANREEVRFASGGSRPSLSREIVDLVLHSVPVDAGLAERALGIEWTPLGETLDAFDAWARPLGIIPEPPQQPGAIRWKAIP